MRYQPGTKPYDHQRRGLIWLSARPDGGALLMDPRTGKTKLVIDYACALHLAGSLSRVVVVCPVSVMGVWEEELRLHVPDSVRARVTFWDRRGRKDHPLPPVGEDVLDFLVVNYDAFSTPGKKTKSGRRSKKLGGRFEVTRRLERWSPDLLVLDESHRIKSPSAKKTRALVKLARSSPRRVIMTGTVVTKAKRVFDVYSQWKVINPDRFADVPTFAEFRDRYGVWTTRNGFPQWLRNRNVKELRDRVHADSFAVRRDECFDLPPRRDQIVPVDLVEAALVYDEMAQEMVARLESGELVEASMKLTQILRLQQITSGVTRTTLEDGQPGPLRRVGREKIDVFGELVSDLFEADEKIVVAARFLSDVGAAAKMCRRLGGKVFMLHGKVPPKERTRRIEGFRRSEGPAAFVAQASAGSLGIDLSTAAVQIWFSLTPSYVDFMQMQDRIALSRRETTFMYLIARRTVDEMLLEVLRADGDVVRAITQRPDRLLRQ